MSLSEYLRFPDGFIFIAVRTISIKPPRSRCRRLHIKQQTRSNRTTSCCFEAIRSEPPLPGRIHLHRGPDDLHKAPSLEVPPTPHQTADTVEPHHVLLL